MLYVVVWDDGTPFSIAFDNRETAVEVCRNARKAFGVPFWVKEVA